MNYVYLASFVEALQGVIQLVFENVLAPILKDIFEIIAKYFLTLIWSLFSEWLLLLLTMLCSLVDFVENIFNIFAGISLIEVEGEQTYLLDAFMQRSEITTAFTWITVLAFAIGMIFTIVKTAQSISDMTLEDKNPVSKVLADAMRAGLSFLLIPFLCIFLLQASSIVTKQAVSAFDAAQGGSTTIGTIIFLMAGLDADKATTEEMDPIEDEYQTYSDNRSPSFTDDVRYPYFTGEKDYTDLSVVKQDFYPANFNFVAGIGSAILLLLVLTGAIMIFIRRLFDLLLLYVVSPLFASTIPLDEGQMFSKWRDLFVAKFFSGFGVIFSMRYYLMLIPLIAGSNLTLYSYDLPNAGTINTILKIFVIIGGAWAVYKSQSLILQILNYEAAESERQAGSFITGLVIGGASMAATAAAGAATGGGSLALGGGGKLASQALSGAGQSMMNRARDENGAFRG
ncbi:MAG: hypothetical protein LUE86_01990 [Clostridiales bacterium]|nr:hypothetical protein [Clostridiales bacterium]